MKLYTYWRSLATFRVRITLNLKGIAYEPVYVDLDAGVSRSGRRIRCWLTPLDLPRADLRGLTIVLLASGKVART